jgi:hypothetical protein
MYGEVYKWFLGFIFWTMVVLIVLLISLLTFEVSLLLLLLDYDFLNYIGIHLSSGPFTDFNMDLQEGGAISYFCLFISGSVKKFAF